MCIKLSPLTVHSGAALESRLNAGKFKVGYFLNRPCMPRFKIINLVRSLENGMPFQISSSSLDRGSYLLSLMAQEQLQNMTSIKKVKTFLKKTLNVEHGHM
ncbi:hypothetical protein TNCV_94101 [Trichonephila clavipes]|nr:hypothetical protein TNCV_94101 [Trichonephila clavipes]